MPTAEIIAIGTELLLGETQDTNTRYLARSLRDLGVNVYRATLVGDNAERISLVIREAMQRAQIVITTGGLGPTVDDPTRAAVALALDVETEFRPELWEQIQARFQRYGRAPSENNRRQAWIPQGAFPVENPVGTAPAFICETANSCVIALPGVPREMEHLTINRVIPYLRERFQLTGTIKARVLHVAGVGESIVDEWIGDLEVNPNPTVGLLAHPGQVDIRITASAESEAEADQLIAEMEARVRDRVKEGLFGVDRDTLDGALLQALREHGWEMALVEGGLNGALAGRLTGARIPGEGICILSDPCAVEELQAQLGVCMQRRGAQAGLGISLAHTLDKAVLALVTATPGEVKVHNRSYGGERALAAPWAVNTGLELLRRQIMEE